MKTQRWLLLGMIVLALALRASVLEADRDLP